MWFGYNCLFIFCHFFRIVNLVIFHPLCTDSGTSCEGKSSYNFVPIVLQHCMCFLHGMRMCMWLGYNC